MFLDVEVGFVYVAIYDTGIGFAPRQHLLHRLRG